MYTVFFYFLQQKKHMLSWYALRKKHMLSWYALRKVEDTEEVTRNCQSKKDKQKKTDKRTDIEVCNRTPKSSYLATRTLLKTGCGLN